MWTDWSEWSCSATCGKNGAYRRTRTCIINDGTVMDYIDAEVACGGVADESKDCPNLQPCPDSMHMTAVLHGITLISSNIVAILCCRVVCMGKLGKMFCQLRRRCS